MADPVYLSICVALDLCSFFISLCVGVPRFARLKYAFVRQLLNYGSCLDVLHANTCTFLNGSDLFTFAIHSVELKHIHLFPLITSYHAKEMR